MTLYQQANFLLSATALDQLPSDEGAEVAFIGRSNAGKSSAINAITNIKGLARSSKFPGRTQTINLFKLDEDRRLVDLPGYGYAKVPLQIKQRWQAAVDTYLEQRECLKGLILIMDVRQPLKESDQQMIQWAIRCQLPLHILLTKADKLSHGAASSVLRQVETDLLTYPGSITVQLFSSLERKGLEQAWATLDHWLS
ncbi:MAG: ribosome biogenesis GTP-binding protein YihA/YsxC [Gammaproteobacteria bacterium]